MMHPPNSLSKHITNLQHLQLRTMLQVLLLRHTVRHDHFVQTAGVDSVDSISTEDSVRDESIDDLSAALLEQLSGAGDRV